MKEQKKIPTSKIKRASKILGTGIKVSGNYAKHYTKKVFTKVEKSDLDEANAEDIYKTLSNLKGGALKIAQMMSMNEALPSAFIKQFSQAQYNAPPLSYPLIVKTFKKEFGKTPSDIFDSFTPKAVNAASIGQVHKATINDDVLAIKIQYPGVADSLQTDIKMVKPFAIKLMNITKEELNYYADEVENMLIAETDYEGELIRSIEISNKCKHIENLVFPKYYPEYSGKKIITMSWVDGIMINDFFNLSIAQDIKNKIGQAIWDFYSFQMHTLKQFHADPHPGNFIVTKENKLAIIDFGAVKKISPEIYVPYFKLVLLDPEKDKKELEQLYLDFDIIMADDTPEEKKLFTTMIGDLVDIVKQPLHADFFDFGNSTILDDMFELGELYAKNKELKKANMARGKRDVIFLNKTYFGMYSILSKLKANIQTNRGEGFVFSEN